VARSGLVISKLSAALSMLRIARCYIRAWVWANDVRTGSHRPSARATMYAHAAGRTAALPDLVAERASAHIAIATKVLQMLHGSRPSSESTLAEYNNRLATLGDILLDSTRQLTEQYNASQAVLGRNARNETPAGSHYPSPVLEPTHPLTLEPTSVLLASEASMEHIISTVSESDVGMLPVDGEDELPAPPVIACLDSFMEGGQSEDQVTLKEDLMEALLSGCPNRNPASTRPNDMIHARDRVHAPHQAQPQASRVHVEAHAAGQWVSVV